MSIINVQLNEIDYHEELSGDAKRRIFMKFIDLYGVNASYGAGMTMTIDHPFKDYLGVFGFKDDQEVTQSMIAPLWKGLCKGTWDFYYWNPFVRYLAYREYCKEHPDGK